MPKKYYSVIVYRSVTDEAALAEYARLVTPLIGKFGGKVIARGKPSAVFEELFPSVSPYWNGIVRVTRSACIARSHIRRPWLYWTARSFGTIASLKAFSSLPVATGTFPSG